MRNGVYRVTFGADADGKGILVAKDGSFWGGDSGYVYTGSYTYSGLKGHAHVQVERDDPDSKSIFGDRDSFTVNLEFNVTTTGFVASGAIVGEPSFRLQAKTIKIADL